jgi:hypothetical protein
MPALHAAAFDKRRRQRRENGRGHDNDDARHRRRFLGIGCEISMMTRVPPLGWPSNLFVDAFTPETESAT